MKLYENKYELKKYGDVSQITGLSLSYDYLKTLKSDKEFQDYLSSIFYSLPPLVQYVDFNKFKTDITIKLIDELDTFLGHDEEEYNEYCSYVASNRKVLCEMFEDECSYKYRIGEKEVTKEEYLKFSKELDQYHCIGSEASTECSIVREIGEKHNLNVIPKPALTNFPLSLDEFANDNLKTKLNLFDFTVKNDNNKYKRLNVFAEKVHGKYQYNIAVSTEKENSNKKVIFTGVNDSSFKFLKEKFEDRNEFEELLEKCIPDECIEKYGFYNEKIYVVDIKTNEIVGEFDNNEDAEAFIEDDQNDHNLEIVLENDLIDNSDNNDNVE